MRLLAASSLLAAAVASAAGHRCIQDELQAARAAANFSEPRHEQDYGGAFDAGGRRLQSAEFAPIRIVPIFLGAAKDGSESDGTGANAAANVVTSAMAAYLQNTIVKAAIDNWQAMLSVVPVTGKLYASRFCAGGYYDFTDQGHGFGCVSYATSNDNFCGTQQGGDLDIPVGDYAGAQTYYTDGFVTANHDLPAGSKDGVANADFVLFVTAFQSTNCPAKGHSGTLAYASTCQRDQHDRPTWGRVNYCPYALSINPADFQLQMLVATHELNHALGFNSGSWPLWRKPDGTPRTTRITDGYGSRPATNFYYTCGGSNHQGAIADTTTVAFSAERDMTTPTIIATSSASGTTIPSRPDFDLSNFVHRIVTPTVVLAARAHFGCDDLAGAELENHLTTPCGMMGSHWEQRVLDTELMSSWMQHTGIVSALTLALHEDSVRSRAIKFESCACACARTAADA